MASDASQFRSRFGRSDVPLHKINLTARNIELSAAIKFDRQVLELLTLFLDQLHSSIDPDTVRKMNNEVPLAKVEEAIDGP